LSFLAGLAYTEYSENSYHVSSALIGVFALRNDFTDWLVATVTGDSLAVGPWQPRLVRIWRRVGLPPRQGLGRRSLRQRQAEPVGGAIHGGVGLRINS
jgi:hypothetical protein